VNKVGIKKDDKLNPKHHGEWCETVVEDAEKEKS
jgi:hypothetical protein